MNERIKELIGQAQCVEVWGNNPYNGLPEFEGYELDAEKLAELIVRECIDKAFHNGHPDLEFLLEHFGVEE
jgi:hypothetical protein